MVKLSVIPLSARTWNLVADGGLLAAAAVRGAGTRYQATVSASRCATRHSPGSRRYTWVALNV